jgi:hypothetical protein
LCALDGHHFISLYNFDLRLYKCSAFLCQSTDGKWEEDKKKTKLLEKKRVEPVLLVCFRSWLTPNSISFRLFPVDNNLQKKKKRKLSLSMADRVSGVFHNCEKGEKQRANNISNNRLEI